MDLSLLADPVSHARLTASEGVLRSARGVWPVLGGIPFLVSDPSRFLAARRDAVVAALALADRFGPTDRAVLRVFVDAVHGVAPEVDGDDFLADEEGAVDAVSGPSSALVSAVLAARPVLPEAIAARVGRGRVLEVGCGAGTVTRRLAGPRFVLDRSVRALLAACDGDALPVVGLAEQLPFRTGVFSNVVAANVVDLLPDAPAFLQEAHRVLRTGGRLVMSTPDPALGGPDEGALDAALEATGFALEDVQDGLPWVRSHGPRHHQLYVARLCTARKV